MIIISVVVFLLAINIFGNRITSDLYGFVLFVMLITVPFSYYDVQEKIAAFNSTQTSLNAARNNGNVLENASLATKVFEQNQWLAKVQYYKTTMWSLWIPSEVNKLKPIK